jgi:diguanylate cyclase (GGDEF)-like protein
MARIEAAGLSSEGLRAHLDALLKHMGTDEFIPALHSLLSEEILRKVEISRWRGILETFFEELAASGGFSRARLTTQLLHARIIHAEMLALSWGSEQESRRLGTVAFRYAMNRVITTLSIEELMSEIAKTFGDLDIRTCFIAIYPNHIPHARNTAWKVPREATVALAYENDRRIDENLREKCFSPLQGLLPELFSRERRMTLVATALYFRKDQMGYMLFEPGRLEPSIYRSFCQLVASVLRGAFLFGAHRKAEERLTQVLAKLEEYNWKLSVISHTDELTGLNNRRGFLSYGAQSLNLARRMGRGGHVFFVDLDGLKTINDTWGHQEGDDALRRTAKVLKSMFRSVDILGRLGGDEFTALTINTSEETVEVLRRRLEGCLKIENESAKKPYTLSMSLGAIPFDTASATDLEELLGRADSVLYEDKRRKK